MIGVFEAIALVGYSVAFVALVYGAIAVPARSKFPLLFMAAAMGLMVFVSASNALEHLGITAALDPFEDYAEIMYIPLVCYGVYGYLITSQGENLASARYAAQSEHHMLLEIVESIPVGIAIVDVGGRIGYANPAARELLELQDDPSTLGYMSPGKVMPENATAEPDGILTVDPGEAFDDAPYVFKKPNGQVPLLLSAIPLHPDPPYGASVVTIRHRTSD